MINYKVKKIQNYIGGELVAPNNEQYLDNYNPATGSVFCELPSSDESDLEKAYQAASEAFPKWSDTPSYIRSRILLRIADLLEQYLDDLAFAESMDNGKPLSIAKSIDVPISARHCRFFATGFMHMSTQFYQTENSSIDLTTRIPLGVVSTILPWNMPLYALTWKVSSAIASGNCVIVKPSEATPLTAYLFAQICIEAGLPPGVINILFGEDERLNKLIANHPGVKAISFTGGGSMARQIAEWTAVHFKKAFIESGSNNPSIIFKDCNYDEMMRTTLRSTFLNQGQSYYSVSKIYVEEAIYEQVKNELVTRVSKLTVGDPMVARTRQGAIGSKKQYHRLLNLFEEFQKEGGILLYGGKAAKVTGSRCKNGWFIEPTIFENLDDRLSELLNDFYLPVVTISPFINKEELFQQLSVKKRAGLGATIWTNDIKTANELTRKLKYGVIGVNTWFAEDLRIPHGGYTGAGIGRDGGWDTFYFYTEPKNICTSVE